MPTTPIDPQQRWARWRIRVPATAANLGPGFDCMGLALQRYLTLEVNGRDSDEASLLTITGHGAGVLPTDEGNLVCRAFRQASGRHVSLAKLSLAVHSEIPLARGQGSSAAAAVAGLAAGQLLSHGELDVDEIVREGAGFEGHPDNVAPATLGGFVVSWIDGDQVRARRVETSETARFVVAAPEFPLSTRDARAVLPESVPWSDAVFNARAAAWMAAAWAAADWPEVGRAMVDRLHQPHRASLIPGFSNVCNAARGAGAFGACLSGAGPTVLALADERAEAVGTAMVEAWAEHGVQASADVLPAENRGLVVERMEEGSNLV